jgi:hypothetical protein
LSHPDRIKRAGPACCRKGGSAETDFSGHWGNAIVPKMEKANGCDQAGRPKSSHSGWW